MTLEIKRTAFQKWIDTFFEEKNIDLETIIEIPGESGVNLIPVKCVLDTIKSTSKKEQKEIKKIFVMIDFKNGDILHFVKHLAQAIAI